MRAESFPIPTGGGLARLVGLLTLVGLVAACDPGAEAPPERESTRTGGIFGGTPAPRSAEDSAPEPGDRSSGAARATTTDDRRTGAPRPRRMSGLRSADTAGVDVSGMGYTVGSPDAPIRVVEFSDFGCGYCRKFHLETYPTLHEEYVETGKVRWTYIPFVLGIFPNGVEAARAGECAIDQGRFPPIRDRFFEDQDAWQETDDPLGVFVRLAREEGLDAERFRSCLEERQPEERVRRNIQLGQRVGVRGTPTFLVEGHPLQGALPVDVFRQVFERVLRDPAVGGGSTGGGEG